MQLREQVYKAVDCLDDKSLRLAFAYITSLPGQGDTQSGHSPRRYSLDELDALSASDTGDWGKMISDDREDRV